MRSHRWLPRGYRRFGCSLHGSEQLGDVASLLQLELHQGVERVGPRRRRAGRQPVQEDVQGLLDPGGVAQRPEQQSLFEEDLRGPQRRVRWVEQGPRLAQQPARRLVPAGQSCRAAGGKEQRGPVRHLGCRRVVEGGPEGQAAFQQQQLLAVRRDAARRHGRSQGCRVGKVRLSHNPPVVGRLDHRSHIRRAGLLQELRVALVEGNCLARQEVLLDGLPQQRVADVVAPQVAVDHEQVVADQLAQRRAQNVRRQPTDRGDGLLVDRAPAGGHGSQDGRRVARQRPGAAQHELTQTLRYLAVVDAPGRRELLDEERHAGTVPDDPLGEHGLRGCPEDPCHLPDNPVRNEPVQVEPFHVWQPQELVEDLVDVRVRLRVCAQAGDEEDAAVAERTAQVGHQVAGGGVGPVQVLHDEHHRLLQRCVVQQPRDCVEQLIAMVLGGFPRGAEVQGGSAEEGPQGCGRRSDRLLDRLGAERGTQVSDRRPEGRVWQGAARQWHAAASDDEAPRGCCVIRQLGEQPGLADARLACQQNRPGRSCGGLGPCLAQDRQLRHAVDEVGTGHPSGHAHMLSLAPAPNEPLLRPPEVVTLRADPSYARLGSPNGGGTHERGGLPAMRRRP